MKSYKKCTYISLQYQLKQNINSKCLEVLIKSCSTVWCAQRMCEFTT